MRMLARLMTFQHVWPDGGVNALVFGDRLGLQADAKSHSPHVRAVSGAGSAEKVGGDFERVAE
ncbi:hypothetical protein MesoLj113c_02990 [Mesorhizobium sp. 113-3-9]|nr:hypothetical protein MesoLj113c_02990 [Mesorhizobium sp. 113-3-9]